MGAAHHPDGAVVFQGHHVVVAQLHVLHPGEDHRGLRVELLGVVADAVDQVIAPEIEVPVLGDRRAGVIVGGRLHHVPHDEIGLVGLLLRLVVALAQLVAGVVPPGVEVAVLLDDGQHRAGRRAVGDVAVVVVLPHLEYGLVLHRAGGHRLDPGHDLHRDVGADLAVKQLGRFGESPAVEVAVAGHRPGIPRACLHLPDKGLLRRRGGDGQQSGQGQDSQQQGEMFSFFPHMPSSSCVPGRGAPGPGTFYDTGPFWASLP